MLFLSLLTASAGFFHPRDVAASSSTYAAASERMADQAEQARRDARALALALQDYEEALDLLGERASAAERDRLAELERRYHRDLAVLQAAVDELVGGFDAAFSSSLERALADHPGAVRCEREVASGPSIPGLGARRKTNPACQGEDLNATLARALDADPRLVASLDTLPTELPGFGLTVEPMPGPERWVGVAPFFQAVAGSRLRAIRHEDETARLPIEAAIEQGASPEELAELEPRAREIDAQTAEKRARLAAPVLARADVVLAKRAPEAGWCAQPVRLGGCTGSQATESIAGMLREDRKLLRAIP